MVARPWGRHGACGTFARPLLPLTVATAMAAVVHHFAAVLVASPAGRRSPRTLALSFPSVAHSFPSASSRALPPSLSSSAPSGPSHARCGRPFLRHSFSRSSRQAQQGPEEVKKGNESQRKRLVVIGGGAAGFMGAIEAARAGRESGLEVSVIEATSNPLNKVKISGGGRCNVMQDARKPPSIIAEGYPRGRKPLLGMLNKFGPTETYEWFTSRGVRLKTEGDGRMFPITDKSQTIIDCLVGAAEECGVKVVTKTRVEDVELVQADDMAPNAKFEIECVSPRAKGMPPTVLRCDYLLVATGSYRPAFEWAQRMGHRIESPVPSLFTFETKEEENAAELAGISVQDADLKLIIDDNVIDTTEKKKKKNKKLQDRGPVLFTHTGLSGPAILRLSAFGARELHGSKYSGSLIVNWLAGIGVRNSEEARRMLEDAKKTHAAKLVTTFSPLGLPKRLWRSMLRHCNISEEKTWAQLSKKEIIKFSEELTSQKIRITGKGAFKDEFVTCGGVSLKDVDTKTLQSKKVPGLFFAGEILNIDGITGGYNFQSAWSTGWHAGSSIGALAGSRGQSEARI